MTKQSTSASNYRLTRRHAMLAAAGGAATVGIRDASAQVPKLPDSVARSFAAFRGICERTCALLGSTTLNELLGATVKPFKEILTDGLGSIDAADRPLVETLIQRLDAATSSTREVYYRDFYTMTPAAWGNGQESGVIQAMIDGDRKFSQPHLLHINNPTSSELKYQISCALDGWRSKKNKQPWHWISGFVELCGDETVIEAFQGWHEGDERFWIEHHLRPWLTSRSVGWAPSMFATRQAAAPKEAATADPPTVYDACTAYNSGAGYFCSSHPGSKCKLNSNGEPKGDTDYCDPPSEP